jgi:hypothetical protein
VDVETYRAAWRAEHVGPGYRGPLHLAVTSTVALAAIAFAASRVHDVRPLEWLVLPVGFLVANLAEYLGHKGPMHHRRRGLGLLFERHTGQHHAFFAHDEMAAPSSRDWKAVLFPWYVVLFFLGALATPIGLGIYAVAGANAGWLFGALAVSYFLAYEWLHLAYHQPDDSMVGRVGVVRALRRHHARHHDAQRMTRGNFNITFPICDAVFRTVLRD